MLTAHHLIIMRHAKTEAEQGSGRDHERSLTDRGVRDAAAAGRWLAEHDLIPDGILCSTAVRAQQTAAGVTACWDREVTMQSEQRLYLATPEAVVQCIRQGAADWGRVLVIGHNPGLEILAGHYSGACGHFQTSAAIALQFELAAWKDLTLSSKPTVIASYHP